MSDTPVTAAQPKFAGMSCPRCRIDLVMSDRQGVEIDYCPSCRGVWLDRGELDKIIERSAAYEARTSVQQAEEQGSYPARGRHDQGGHGRRDDRGYRRRGFLGELFD